MVGKTLKKRSKILKPRFKRRTLLIRRDIKLEKVIYKSLKYESYSISLAEGFWFISLNVTCILYIVWDYVITKTIKIILNEYAWGQKGGILCGNRLSLIKWGLAPGSYSQKHWECPAWQEYLCLLGTLGHTRQSMLIMWLIEGILDHTVLTCLLEGLKTKISHTKVHPKPRTSKNTGYQGLSEPPWLAIIGEYYFTSLLGETRAVHGWNLHAPNPPGLCPMCLFPWLILICTF